MSLKYQGAKVYIQAGYEMSDDCKREIFERMCEEADGTVTMQMLEDDTSYSRRSLRKHISESKLITRDKDYTCMLVSFVSTDSVSVQDLVSVALRAKMLVDESGITNGGDGDEV